MIQIHIVPDEDLMEYELSTACGCGPTIEIAEGRSGDIVRHAAFDGREQLEEQGPSGLGGWLLLDGETGEVLT